MCSPNLRTGRGYPLRRDLDGAQYRTPPFPVRNPRRMRFGCRGRHERRRPLVNFHRPPRRLQCKRMSCCVIRTEPGGLVIGPGKIHPRARKCWVLVERLLEESDGLVQPLLSGRQDSVPAEKILLIGAEVFWPLPLRRPVLRLHDDPGRRRAGWPPAGRSRSATANTSAAGRSQRSDQTCAPVLASMSWAVTRI